MATANPVNQAPLFSKVNPQTSSSPDLSQPSSSSASHTPAPPPPMLRYTDGNGIDHEIFISPGRYEAALNLLEAEDSNTLSQFPPYSDRPPLKPAYPNSLSFQNGDGVTMSIYLPDDDGKSVQRATELWKENDWEGLEREFEPWAGQPRKDAEEREEWQRGVERIARARVQQVHIQGKEGA